MDMRTHLEKGIFFAPDANPSAGKGEETPIPASFDLVKDGGLREFLIGFEKVVIENIKKWPLFASTASTEKHGIHTYFGMEFSATRQMISELRRFGIIRDKKKSTTGKWLACYYPDTLRAVAALMYTVIKYKDEFLEETKKARWAHAVNRTKELLGLDLRTNVLHDPFSTEEAKEEALPGELIGFDPMAEKFVITNPGVLEDIRAKFNRAELAQFLLDNSKGRFESGLGRRDGGFPIRQALVYIHSVALGKLHRFMPDLEDIDGGALEEGGQVCLDLMLGQPRRFPNLAAIIEETMKEERRQRRSIRVDKRAS